MKKLLRSPFEFEDIDEGIYSQDNRKDMLENDEISGWEAAFMDGYDDASLRV